MRPVNAALWLSRWRPKDARRFGGHGHGDDEPWTALDHCGEPRRGLGGRGESVSQHRQLTHQPPNSASKKFCIPD
ncbi:MAG: hypothetical protein WCC90_04450, partial [Methylocella sp.]